MNPVRSQRLAALPPFLFDEIDRKKRERIAAGADVINLGVGDPDRPTPSFIVEAMDRAMREPVNQQYPAVGGGLKVFREAAADFMLARFGVHVDPMRHVLALLGSKDGIAHLPWAVTNPGDAVIVPDPAYPVYAIGAGLAHCRIVRAPLDEEGGWLPDLDAPPEDELDRARILWLNYPSNPTAASADARFLARAAEWCDRRGVVCASDLAYSELYFDQKPPSLWQAADIERHRGIEFHSLSKTFNMTGWRIGFAVGHGDVIAALQEVKSNVDSGTFNAIQASGAVALRAFDHPDVEAMRRLYRERRDAAIAGLASAGCRARVPDAGFFVWARCPEVGGEPIDSLEFASRALGEADVVVVPGGGFSPRGARYFRVALTVDAARLAQAGERLARVDFSASPAVTVRAGAREPAPRR